jgi:hypothetical protein
VNVEEFAALLTSQTQRITALERAISRRDHFDAINAALASLDGRLDTLEAATIDARLDVLEGWGATTTWTPVLKQSNTITIAGNQSRYSIDGEWVIGRFQFSVATGQTGTAGNPIKISLPVTADIAIGNIGVASLYDDSAGNRWPAILDMTSTTECWLADTTLGGAAWAIGTVAFTAALANPDGLSGSFMYRKA